MDLVVAVGNWFKSFSAWLLAIVVALVACFTKFLLWMTDGLERALNAFETLVIPNCHFQTHLTSFVSNHAFKLANHFFPLEETFCVIEGLLLLYMLSLTYSAIKSYIPTMAT